MIVNRRTALKQILVVSAGAALLPSCLQDTSKSSILLKNFSLTADQEKGLAELSGVLIPTDSTPGAKDVSAHLFALKMLDDCYSKADQERFLRGWQALDAAARKATGKSFAGAEPAQREDLVKEMEKTVAAGNGKATGAVGGPADETGDLAFMYRTMKGLTIHAYTSSQFFLTKVHVYELVPGRYHGCVPVKHETAKAS